MIPYGLGDEIESKEKILYVIEYLFAKKFLMMLIDPKLFRSNVTSRSTSDASMSCDFALFISFSGLNATVYSVLVC